MRPPGLWRTLLLCTALLALGSTTVHADAAKARAAFRKAAQLYKDGDKQEALEAYQASYEQNSDANTLYHIALCHWDLGANDDAIHFFNLYLERAPGAIHRDQAQAALRELEGQVRPARQAGPSSPRPVAPPSALVEAAALPPEAPPTHVTRRSAGHSPHRRAHGQPAPNP